MKDKTSSWGALGRNRRPAVVSSRNGSGSRRNVRHLGGVGGDPDSENAEDEQKSEKERC